MTTIPESCRHFVDDLRFDLCKYIMKLQIQLTCGMAFHLYKVSILWLALTWDKLIPEKLVTFARVTSFIYANSSWGGHCFKIKSSCFHYSWRRINKSWEERLLFIINGGDKRWRSAFFLFEVLFGTLVMSYGIYRVFRVICSAFFAKIYQRKVIL